MQTIVYNGSFEGFLCAVFDVYEYKFTNVNIVPAHRHQPSLFAEPHIANFDLRHSDRVWKGLQKKLTNDAQEQIHRTFLSEIDGIENTLLAYIQYAFAAEGMMEEDFSNAAVRSVFQTAKKLGREKQRLETGLRFQKTADGLHYALIEPEYNLLPLVAEHFQNAYAGHPWLIYDLHRRYGMYYDRKAVSTVQIQFSDAEGNEGLPVYDESEGLYRELWKRYFRTAKMGAPKNTRLHIRQMPRQYWKPMVKRSLPNNGGSLQERLTNWTYRRA